ncbi:MAG: polyprenyl synthetase family protein [Thermoleophilia bacterium]|nr:polyprenyl synthetase family protein [Thermoleophilia bacterium]
MTGAAAIATSASFLEAVDEHMVELLAHRDGVVAAAARRPIAAGGKRLRPLLVRAARPLAVDEGDASFDQAAVRAAAAIELVHTASLVHDDLLDDASVRRGEPTIGAVDGRTVAVAAGDLLFSRAFATLVTAREFVGDELTLAATQVLARSSKLLAEGEALQARQTRRPGITVDEYLNRCRLKTGALFSAALQCGALLGGASDEDAAVLGQFGDLVGLAFQIADDVLDSGDPSTEAVLGKRPGADLRDGTITLPMLAALATDAALADALAAPIADDEVAGLLARIHAAGGLEAARRTALQLADEAVALVEPLAGRFDVTRLRAIAARSVDRLY